MSLKDCFFALLPSKTKIYSTEETVCFLLKSKTLQYRVINTYCFDAIFNYRKLLLNRSLGERVKTIELVTIVACVIGVYGTVNRASFRQCCFKCSLESIEIAMFFFILTASV